MKFFLEFFFYILFIFIRLYFLLDKKYIFSTNGSKLKKYVNELNLTNMTNNLVNCKNNFFFKKRSPKWYKQVLFASLVTISITLFKISITYNLLVSNFFYITLFNKNIDIISKFSKYFFYFKILYYISFYIFTFNLTYFFLKIISIKNNSKKSVPINSKNIQIKIGEDVDKNNIFLQERGLFQNVLITGSIGSGKTSSAISNILEGLLENDVYGLIIDVKGTYLNTLKKIASKYNKEKNIIEISLNSDFIYNPLDKKEVSSFELANRLKQVLLLTSKSNTSDSYWLDKAESCIRDFITIIRSYSEYVDFYELHNLVVNKEYLEGKLNKIKENIVKDKYEDNYLFNLNSAITNIKNEYLLLDDRTIGIIKSEITRITSIFVSEYSLYKKFCTKSQVLDFNLNKIVVLSINIGENKLLSKIISTYLKLDFQKQILSRNLKSKNTFFICDEYQEFANEEDARFFSISREYKCINIISMQSYNSLLNALEKDSATNVIIQNLVNKIWFRNDDIYTVNEIIKQIGKENKSNKSISFSENSQNSKYNFITNKFKTIKSGLSESYSISNKLEYKYSEEFFTQELKTFEAICLLSDGDKVNLTKKVKFKRWEE